MVIQTTCPAGDNETIRGAVKQSFGVKLPGTVPVWATTYREIPEFVVELEKLGFDDVMDGEHILFTNVMDHPGGAGNMVHARDTQHSDRADTLVMLSAIAARTTTIKFVSGILLSAAHGFAVLARQASTLDLISDGRFMLGVGMGWNAAEFAAQGIPPKECQKAGRDPSTVGFRCSLTPTSWGVPSSADELIEGVVRNAQRLAAAGITHFTVPLNYYRLGLDDLGRLLQALRSA